MEFPLFRRSLKPLRTMEMIYGLIMKNSKEPNKIV